MTGFVRDFLYSELGGSTFGARGAVAGGFAYCTAVGGLVIVDISDQKNPALVKSVDLGGRVTDVAVDGRYAFLAAGPKGVLVLDVKDPADPIEVGRYPAGKGFAAAQIAVRRIDDTDEYLIYVANPRGPATVLLFHAPGTGRAKQ